MTRADGTTREPFLRIALAAVVAADLACFVVFLGAARADALAAGVAPGVFAELVSRLPVRVVVALVGIAAAAGFARRPGRLVEGLLALAALMVCSTAHTELFGSPWRHTFFSGVCLTGWLLGVAVARRRGTPDDESWARTGAVALLGASYANAGISKLVYGGFEWLWGATIQAIVVAQVGLVGGGLRGAYRALVTGVPLVAAFFSVATVLLELGGPLMLGGSRLRRLIALGLLAMHANIFLLTDILYWEAMVFLALFGLWPDAPAPVSRPERRAGGWRFAVAVGALSVAALVAVLHQERRYVAVEAARVAAMPGPGPTEAPSRRPPPSVARLGPFAVGETVGEGWVVETLSNSEQGVVIAMAGPAGRTAFEVTCAVSPHASPFDLGAVHVFYSSTLPVDAFETAGRALQARLRAAGGGDLCAAVARWRAAVAVGEGDGATAVTPSGGAS